MSVALLQAVPVLPNRFGYLMGLYAENYRRLVRLFAAHRLGEGCYASDVDDGLAVHLEVLERQPYTVDICLSYLALDQDTGAPAPSAQLRIYLDACVAEAMHCEPGRALWQVLGPLPATKSVLEHRLRMATFLGKWLEYLAEQGHSLGTLQRQPVLA